MVRRLKPLMGFVAVGVASLLIVLSACGSGDKASGSKVPHNGGSLVDLQNFAGGSPDHIDPALADDVQSAQIPDLLFDGLTATQSDGTIKNDIADSVTPSNGGTVWTFHLKDTARFSNGDPVLASDFKYAWQRVLDPALKSKLTSRLSLIKGAAEMNAGKSKDLTGVTADDAARTLRVELVSPYQDLPALVSLPVFSPVPQRVVRNLSSQSGWEKTKMIGNGPFVMASAWEPTRSVMLERSDTYSGGIDGHKPYVDKLEFRVSGSLDSAYTDFEGQKDAIGRIPPAQYGAASSRYGADVVNSPLLSTEYWGFNMKDPAVGGDTNKVLRQAIAAAIDKKDINDKVYDGSRQVATSWSPPSLPGAGPPGSSGGRDLQKAKDLMVQYAKASPRIKISFASGQGHDEKASIIAQNLKDAGIDATPDPMDPAAFRKAVGMGTLQLFRGNWVADYSAYDNYIAPLFTTDAIGSDNVFSYSNASVDSRVKDGQKQSDPVLRNNDYIQAEQQMLADQVVVPLDWTTASLVKSPSVHDLSVTPLGNVDYVDVWLSS